MTREEAKRRMEICRDFLANNYSDIGEPNFTAFEMAIQALSQEPTISRLERRVDDNTVVFRTIDGKEIEYVRKEPCDDAISYADRLLDLANAIESDDSGYWTNKRISSTLRNIPPVTQKSGKWEFHCQHWSKCSICGYADKFADKWNYCPNCGAKMENVEKSLIDIKAESEDKE